MSKGGNIKTLIRRLDIEQIDYSHIPRGRGANRGLRRGGRQRRSLSEIMIKESSYNPRHLKTRLVRDEIVPYICHECDFDPNKQKWNSKKLVLILDHINGVSNDHRKKNLRFLCPNCNSQTSTFAGRRKQYRVV